MTPFTMRATGRRARWSISASPSKVATSSVGAGGEQRCDGTGRAEPGVHPALERDDENGMIESVVECLSNRVTLVRSSRVQGSSQYWVHRDLGSSRVLGRAPVQHVQGSGRELDEGRPEPVYAGSVAQLRRLPCSGGTPPGGCKRASSIRTPRRNPASSGRARTRSA